MQRIDDRTVELTDDEQVAEDLFEDFLDRGMGCPEAASATAVVFRARGVELDEEFVNYLAT